MNLKTIILVGVGSFILGALCSCNNDFMDRFPTTEISDENFWKSERDMELYCNGLYTFIEGHASGYTVSPMLSGDNQSDNMAPQDYNKIAAGEHIVPAKSGGSEWNWEFVRKCNYFLVRYDQAEVDQAKKDAYA